MKITDEGAPRAIADALKKRVSLISRKTMTDSDVNVNVNFYKKDDPGKKIGVARLNGSLDLSLPEAAAIGACGLVLLGVLGTIRHAIRKLI